MDREVEKSSRRTALFRPLRSQPKEIPYVPAIQPLVGPGRRFCEPTWHITLLAAIIRPHQERHLSERLRGSIPIVGQYPNISAVTNSEGVPKCRRWESNPQGPSPREFESRASASSATPALRPGTSIDESSLFVKFCHTTIIVRCFTVPEVGD